MDKIKPLQLVFILCLAAVLLACFYKLEKCTISAVKDQFTENDKPLFVVVSKSVAYPGLDKVCAYEMSISPLNNIWCKDGINGLDVGEFITQTFIDNNGNIYYRVTIVFKHGSYEL